MASTQVNSTQVNSTQVNSAQLKSPRLKVGGQALADGVLMRTPRAWAIARADGSVEVGEVPPVRFAKVPVLRVLFGLGAALQLGIVKGLMRRGSRRPNKGNIRFLAVLVAIEAVSIAGAVGLSGRHLTTMQSVFMNGVPLVATLFAMRVLSPASLWRYHGAEHKAVTAYEQEIDVSDTAAVMRCSRIHDRCGTNLVAVMLVMAPAMLPLPGLAQGPVFLIGFAAVAELLTLSARQPRSLASRAFLAPGKWLQRHVTTVEPSFGEQAIGSRALLECLAEHARLEALDAFGGDSAQRLSGEAVTAAAGAGAPVAAA